MNLHGIRSAAWLIVITSAVVSPVKNPGSTADRMPYLPSVHTNAPAIYPLAPIPTAGRAIPERPRERGYAPSDRSSSCVRNTPNQKEQES